MKNAFAIIALIIILYGCGGRHVANKSTDSTLKDSTIKRTSVVKKKTVNNATVDSLDNTEPTATEVLHETLNSYNKIEKTDKLIMDGTDSLKIHLKYYCLHDSTLIVPAKYDWRETPKKDFRTHNFAAKIVVLRNQDTVFNHVVLKSWFNKVIYEDLKQYATIVGASFYNYDKVNKHLEFTFSISIPMTDVGIGASLLIDKHGGYEITK